MDSENQEIIDQYFDELEEVADHLSKSLGAGHDEVVEQSIRDSEGEFINDLWILLDGVDISDVKHIVRKGIGEIFGDAYNESCNDRGSDDPYADEQNSDIWERAMDGLI